MNKQDALAVKVLTLSLLNCAMVTTLFLLTHEQGDFNMRQTTLPQDAYSEAIQARVDALKDSGIQSHSQPMRGHSYVIFASDMLDINVKHCLDDRGIFFKDLIGRYRMDDGTVVQETSFIINEKDFMQVQDLIQEQESVLVLTEVFGQLDQHRHAFLEYIDDARPSEYLGQLVPITEEEANERDAMTYDPYLKQHFGTTFSTDAAQAMAYKLEEINPKD